MSINIYIVFIKKKRGSIYPPTVSVSLVDRVTETADSTCDTLGTLEPEFKYSNDAQPSCDEEKDPIPDFPEFEMKLRIKSVPYQVINVFY